MDREYLDSVISSKEILEKTSISRATLNNYIKLGILPKPLVRRADSDQNGAKKIGYFPIEVLDRIKTVKRLKRSGESMQAIALKFRKNQAAEIPSEEVRVSHEPPSSEVSPVTSFLASDEKAASRLAMTLNLDDYPAYLINPAHEIAWTNKKAETLILNPGPEPAPGLNSRNIFKLFLSNRFREGFDNWEEVIGLHLKILKTALPKGGEEDIFEALSKISMLTGTQTDKTDRSQAIFETSPIDFFRPNGLVDSFKLHTLVIEQGVVFIYVPVQRAANEIDRILARRGEEIMALPGLHAPEPTTFCVLVANLQDAVKIRAELPPEEYLELVNEVWQNAGHVLEKYKGLVGKWSDCGAQYYFIKGPAESHAMNAVNCAIELRAMMNELNRKWLARKSWANDLRLNIAVNEGQEFSGTIWSSSNVEFAALGDSVGRAVRLADFVSSGSIWATKDVLGCLSAEQRGKIRFGVHQVEQGREIFIPSSFTRIVDVLGRDDPEYGRFIDIATLPITEIMDCFDRLSNRIL